VRNLWPTPTAQNFGTQHGKDPCKTVYSLETMAKKGMLGSSPADSHAKTSPLRVRARESGEVGPVFGLSIGASFGTYDHDTQLWKTCQRSLFEDLPMYWDRLPRSGMTRNGRIFAQRTWVLRTGGRGSGSWPTPQAEMPGAGPDNSKVKNLLTGNRHSFYLTQAVEAERQKPGVITGQKWPTPQRRDGDQRGAQAKRYHNPERSNDLPDAMAAIEGTGQLNPTWVDWLMGYPIGWTDSEDSEMQLYLK